MKAKYWPEAGKRGSRKKNGFFIGSGGFTLLEVLVAFVILTVVVTVILQLFSANLKTLRVSDDYVTATALADAKMREVLEGASLKEGLSSETTQEGYRMDITITETLEKRTKDLTWKILEVALNVSWKKGMKERSLFMKTLKAVKREAIKNEGP
ncbi:MAG TPA: prepilin-type N-terminal cleavage/methylation domain-containing protein [Syntrophorhabdaceae bacterium]|nr:prepilin-type N-terminal cleavage/methylation domain-containing protein [Syntrophorhabdaceae bacterium]